MLILAVLHHRLKHYEKGNEAVEKAVCLIPLLITTVHYFVYVWGVDSFLRRYTPMYLTALLALLPAMCAGLKKSCKAVSVITGALSVVFAAYFFTSSTKPHNFYAEKLYQVLSRNGQGNGQELRPQGVEGYRLLRS